MIESALTGIVSVIDSVPVIEGITLFVGGLVSGLISLYVADYFRRPKLTFRVGQHHPHVGEPAFHKTHIAVENTGITLPILGRVRPRPAHECIATARLFPDKQPHFTVTLSWDGPDSPIGERGEVHKTIYPSSNEKNRGGMAEIYRVTGGSIRFCLKPDGEDQIYFYGNQSNEDFGEADKIYESLYGEKVSDIAGKPIELKVTTAEGREFIQRVMVEKGDFDGGYRVKKLD